MNYDIKLYVHGVPGGQCTWGVENLDSNYINTFYGRKSNVPVQMFTEIRRFGSSAYSYYTYYVGNTRDHIGRPGGYFALTLRINYYYSDIRNIYNLLDAAFNKFIVGSAVKTENGVVKYTISDFSQVDANLKALEQEINKYLMQFSSDPDFVSLNGFKANGQNEAASLNLFECDAKVVADHVKLYSLISISPYHPSSREQHIIKEMTVKIDAITTQAQREVADAQRNKEISIQTIRDEYKDADKTICGLREEIKKANKEITRLGGIVNELKLKVQNGEAYKKNFEDSQKQLESANAALARIRDNLSELSDLTKVIGMPSNLSHGRIHGDDSKRKEEGISFMKIIRGIHPFIDFFVMIALLGIIGFTLPKSCEGDVGSSKKPLVTNERIKQSEKQLNNIPSEGTNGIPTARIDVTGIDADKPMKYGSTDIYTVSLKNVEGDLRGKWESSDFTIDKEKITPKHKGACSISYVVDGKELVTRTFTVE